MATTENVSLDTRFFCLFKGDPGAGKSIAAASYPGHETDPKIGPYFFDNDGRIKSVINYWRRRGREFHYDRFHTFLALAKKVEEFYNYGCPYRTIVYDGITSGSDQILKDMVDTRGTDNPNAKRNIRAGIELNQLEDYGGELKGFTVLLDNLQAISLRWGTNVIVTAHVLKSETTDIKTKTTTVSRQLLTAGKKVAAKLPVKFDEAYHFDVLARMDETLGPQYTVVTRNSGDDWAKTALPIPMRLDFTNDSLYDRIMFHLADKEFVHPVNEPAIAEEIHTEVKMIEKQVGGW